ncbi:MAG: hypothetical protein ACKO85_05660 [Isosphaeraceae bacterium]
MRQMILAQTGNYSSTDSTLLTVKRWIGQSTLSHPSPVSNGDFQASYWLVAMGLLLLLGLVFQGPGKFASGLLKWSIARETIKSGLNRLKQRMVLPLALTGLLLASWTTSQFLNYSDASGLNDLQLSLRTKTIPVFSLELGFLAALVPLRDLTSLADAWPFILVASVASFHFSNKMQFVPRSVANDKENRARSISQAVWALSAIWLLYRVVVGSSSEGGLPLVTGVFVESLLEPALMLFLDSIILAWAITEICDSFRLEQTDIAPRLPEVFALLPAVVVVNFILMPGRYLAHFIWIFWNSLAATSFAGSNPSYYAEMTRIFFWALSDGLIYIQVMVFPLIVLAGSCLNGKMRDTWKIAVTMLRNQASTIFLILAFLGLADVAGVAMINSLVLSHPAESWVLLAADSYCHYFTLFTGLLLLAALIELGIGCELEIIASALEMKSVEAMTAEVE